MRKNIAGRSEKMAISTNKKSKKRAPRKQTIRIKAVIPKPLPLTQKERRSLKRAMKEAGEEFVESVRSKYDDLIALRINDEP